MLLFNLFSIEYTTKTRYLMFKLINFIVFCKQSLNLNLMPTTCSTIYKTHNYFLIVCHQIRQWEKRCVFSECKYLLNIAYSSPCIYCTYILYCSMCTCINLVNIYINPVHNNLLVHILLYFLLHYLIINVNYILFTLLPVLLLCLFISDIQIYIVEQIL